MILALIRLVAFVTRERSIRRLRRQWMRERYEVNPRLWRSR